MNPCERKRAVQERLSGAPISSARIRCADYRNLFKPGQRVSVYLKAAGDKDDGYQPSDVDGVMGTVIGRRDRKWLVYIDHDEQQNLRLLNESGVVKLWPSAITADDDGADPVEKLKPLAIHEIGDPCPQPDGFDAGDYVRSHWLKGTAFDVHEEREQGRAG